MRWEAGGIVSELVAVGRVYHKIEQRVIGVCVSKAGEYRERSESIAEPRTELQLMVVTSPSIFMFQNEENMVNC